MNINNAMNVNMVMSTDLVYALQDEKPSVVHKHKMSGKSIHHIPIVDSNDAKLLLGIVSATDFVRVMFNDIGMQCNYDLLDLRFPTIMDIVSKANNGDVTLFKINYHDTVLEATEKLANGAFHSLPVVDMNDSVIGIITSTDLIRHLHNIGSQAQNVRGMPSEEILSINIENVMSSPTYSLGEFVFALQDEKPSLVRQKMMNRESIHHVPIVDNSGKKLLGMVSSTDFLRVMFNDITDTQCNDDLLDRRFPTIMDIVPKNKNGNVTLFKINERDTVLKATEKLANGAYHSLPVVDRNDNIKGIVTSTDLIMYLHDIIGGGAEHEGRVISSKPCNADVSLCVRGNLVTIVVQQQICYTTMIALGVTFKPYK